VALLMIDKPGAGSRAIERRSRQIANRTPPRGRPGIATTRHAGESPPACAGKTGSRSAWTTTHGDHPRVHGEDGLNRVTGGVVGREVILATQPVVIAAVGVDDRRVDLPRQPAGFVTVPRLPRRACFAVRRRPRRGRTLPRGLWTPVTVSTGTIESAQGTQLASTPRQLTRPYGAEHPKPTLAVLDHDAADGIHNPDVGRGTARVEPLGQITQPSTQL
jgi:hypothetical protein